MHRPLSGKDVTGLRDQKFFVTASHLVRGEDHEMRKEKWTGEDKAGPNKCQGKVSEFKVQQEVGEHNDLI